MKRIYHPGRRALTIIRSYTFRRILLVTSLVALLSIVIVSASALRLYEAELESQKSADTGMLNLGMAKQLAEFWTRNNDQLNLLADAIITSRWQPSEVAPFFSEIITRSKSFDSISYYSITTKKNGWEATELATSDPRPANQKIEWPGAVENALAGSAWSSGVEFDNGGIPFLMISAPVNFVNGEHAVLLARVNMKKLWRWIDELNIQPETNLSVLEAGSGIVVADQARNGLRLKHPYWGIAGDAKLFKISGKIVSFQEVEGTPLAIATTTTLASFTQHLFLVRNWLYGSAIIVLLSAVGFSAERAYRITGPLEHVVTDIENYGRDQNAEFKAKLPGEYGKIYEAFKEMAATLSAKQALLVEKERMAAVGNVLSGIAHEIRYSVNTLLNLVEEVFIGDANSMRLTKKELKDLSEKVTDMLMYGRDLKMNKEELTVEEIIHTAVERETPRANLKKASLKHIQTDEKLVVRGDIGKIVMALSNLIRNAVECEKPGMVVKVYAEKVNGLVVVTVEDNGPGIEPEHLDKILLPFYTTRGRGFGLGLYIVNSVMKAHNGRIEIISIVGEGSKFKMVFGKSL